MTAPALLHRLPERSRRQEIAGDERKLERARARYGEKQHARIRF
jgi:hypothetical protein